MSQRAIDFTAQWVAMNIYTGPHALEGGPHPEAMSAAERLSNAAQAAGILREEIEEDLGDLETFLSEQFEEATNREDERLANKED